MKQGFTLIELLVVISIIGVFASVVLSSLSDVRELAQYTIVRNNMNIITDALVADNDRTLLLTITSSSCSMCSCRVSAGAPVDLRNIDESEACFQNWRQAINNMAAKLSYIADPEVFYRDPWGSPYLLDENEGEFPTNVCRRDSLRSAGSDGVSGTPDDYVIVMPYRNLQCN